MHGANCAKSVEPTESTSAEEPDARPISDKPPLASNGWEPTLPRRTIHTCDYCFRLLENVPATAEIITVDNSTGLYRRTHYLSASLAASIPAWAQVSSWSAVPPLTPTAPICTLSSVMIGNPPANAIMPGTSASPGTMPPLRSLP